MSPIQSKTGSPTVSETNLTTLEQVKLLAAAGEPARALKLVQIPGHDIALKNAKGVCLLRLGQYPAAISLFREMVFKSGCSWVRPDVPTYCKVNFATALLLSGNFAGGTEILGEAMDESAPAVTRMRACLRQRNRQFPFWKTLLWSIGLGPANQTPLQLDFLPGVFEDGIVHDIAFQSKAD